MGNLKDDRTRENVQNHAWADMKENDAQPMRDGGKNRVKWISLAVISVAVYFCVYFLIIKLAWIYVAKNMNYLDVMSVDRQLRPDFFSNFTNATSLIANVPAVLGFVLVMRKAGILQLKPHGGAKHQFKIIGLLAVVFISFLSFETAAATLIDGIMDVSGAVEMQSDAFMKGNKMLMVVSVVLLVPAAEELLFRGIIYGAARQMVNAAAATLISALAFGIAHFNGWISIVTFAIGVIACVSYERTGSLLYPIAIHMINNAAAIIPAIFTLPDNAVLLWLIAVSGLVCLVISVRLLMKMTKGYTYYGRISQ